MAGRAPVFFGDSYSHTYNVPLGSISAKAARQLQLILVRNFETLAISATAYMRVRSRKKYADERSDLALLDERENDYRSELEDAWNGALEVMGTLLALGVQPLPSDSRVDKDVAEVLHTPRLLAAAQAQTAAQAQADADAVLRRVETIAKPRADAAVLCRSKAAAKAQAKSEASSKALADALGPASAVLCCRRAEVAAKAQADAEAATKARADAEAAAKAQADAIGPAAAVIRHRHDAEIKKAAESSKRRRGV